MNRFHNKYHRHNHHTNATAGEPDSSHDPIASPSDPFQGDFYVNGTLSAKQGIFDNMSYTGAAATFDQLLITPKAATTNHYFKINSTVSTYPLAEVYLNSNPIFVIKQNKVGIGTSTPANELDVQGSGNISQSLSITNNLTAGGTSQLGYLQLSFVTNANSTITANKGSSAINIKAGAADNLKLFANNSNNFTGKLGIRTDSPVETLTINGSQGFRRNGIVLMDNSYYNTLRIITNRQVDSDQHLFTFTGDGRYIAGTIHYESKYPDNSTNYNPHKLNLFTTKSDGKMLSITNFTPNNTDTGPVVDFNRANGDLTNLKSITTGQTIGSIRAHGYESNEKNCNRVNASISFKSSNDYTTNAQGAFIEFSTVCSADIAKNIYPRIVVGDNGRVGIGTGSPTSRLHIKDGDLITGTGTGVTQDVLTIESGNELNGILIKSNTLNSRIYNKNSSSTLAIDVGTTTEAVKITGGSVTIKNSLTVATTNYTSDIKYKKHIQPIYDGLDKIDAINGIYFTWNEEVQDIHTGNDIGVVAQDVERVLPEAVTEDENGIKLVQYHKIIPLLVECIKELKREIKDLQGK